MKRYPLGSRGIPTKEMRAMVPEAFAPLDRIDLLHSIATLSGVLIVTHCCQ